MMDSIQFMLLVLLFLFQIEAQVNSWVIRRLFGFYLCRLILFDLFRLILWYRLYVLQLLTFFVF